MWEISHTREAWENVRLRLSLKKYRKTMIEALLADDAAVMEESDDGADGFDYEKWRRQAIHKYRGFSHSALVDAVMDRIEDHRCCANGGYEFYLDRDGWYSVSVEDLTEHELRYLPDWA
jgi:hypothetical protein